MPAATQSKHLAECCNNDRENAHDAHGQERDSDHYQPRESVLIHLSGSPAIHLSLFASLWPEPSSIGLAVETEANVNLAIHAPFLRAMSGALFPSWLSHRGSRRWCVAQQRKSKIRFVIREPHISARYRPRTADFPARWSRARASLAVRCNNNMALNRNGYSESRVAVYFSLA